MRDSKARSLIIPLVLFSVLLSASVAGWKFSRDILDQQSQNRFEQEADYLHVQIQARFDTYAQVLRGGAGLFNSSSEVTRDEWYRYVKGLNLSRYFPGIQGVGFSSWVGREARIEAHEQRIMAEGFPDYSIKPAEEREYYTAVIYLEPFNDWSRNVLGYDMFAEDTRRIAMERARDTGEPALSGKVDLHPGNNGVRQAGFLLYLPVYRAEKGEPTTIAQRRASLYGYVFSPFRTDELMKGILRKGVSTISFQIHDDAARTAESILYDGATHLESDLHATPVQFETRKTANIAGRKWHFTYSSTPLFTKATDSALPWVLLVTGVLLSMLLSIVAWMLLTTRLRVQQRTNELRKQSEINSVLLENLAEGVVACDADFNVILLNKKARDWFRLDPAEELDLDWARRVTMFEKDGTTPIPPGESPLFRAVAGEVIACEEICILAPGQEPRYVLVTGGPLPARADQKRTGALLSLNDITEYRCAMENIERQQNFLSDVIDNIPNLISARDREGRHVLANRAYAESIYGLTPEQLLADGAAGETNRPSPNDDEMEENRQVIDHGRSLDFVRQIALLDGQYRWFSTGKLPIRSNKSTEIFVLTVASDITELKISEERVITMNQQLESRVRARTTSLEEANRDLEEARQLAENANLAKSSFLAAMSHEIRTPMNGVVGMVEVLINETASKDLKKSLQMVLDSAYSLLSIIDDILDFSKIEAGHFELDDTAVDLTELVESVVQSSVPMARKVDSTVTLYIDPEMPERVLVDVTRFRQVLTNLVGNAIKFSGKQLDRHGHVEVRLSAQHAQALTVQLDVIDNGVGMSADTQERIFDSFVQAESSITRRFGGSGLGLAICKRIVDMMGGEITVVSQPDEGAKFTVSLPLEALTVEADTPRHENVDGVDCVLLESDCYSTADLRRYLQSAGVRVHEVPDYQRAAVVIRELHEPAVVLCSLSHLQQADQNAEEGMPADTGHVVLSREESTLGMNIKRVSLKQGGDEAISAVVVDYNALRRKSLLEAVAIAIGRASPEVMHACPEESVRQTLVPLSIEAAMAAGSCILVVEDDAVNRLVINRQLALLGQTAEVAENGSEAIEKWRQGCYGLVLTDLHMPVMDGYTMTRAIRQEEQAGERIPIVALTANALSGEPRRASDAGVDGYLTKPLQLHSLKEAIDRYLYLPDAGSTASQPEFGEPAELVTEEIQDFDPKVLRQLVGDDPETISECLAEFLVSVEEIGAALLHAVENKDWVSLDQLIHRLRSSSLSIGTLEIWRLCKAIEAARVGEDTDLVPGYVDEMTLAISQAQSAISSHMADDATGLGLRKAS